MILSHNYSEAPFLFHSMTLFTKSVVVISHHLTHFHKTWRMKGSYIRTTLVSIFPETLKYTMESFKKAFLSSMPVFLAQFSQFSCNFSDQLIVFTRLIFGQNRLFIVFNECSKNQLGSPKNKKAEFSKKCLKICPTSPRKHPRSVSVNILAIHPHDH